MTDENDPTGLNFSAIIGFLISIPMLLVGFVMLGVVMDATTGMPNSPFSGEHVTILQTMLSTIVSILPIVAVAGVILVIIQYLFSSNSEDNPDSLRENMSENRQRTLIEKELDLPPAPQKEKNWFARQLTKKKSKQPEKQNEWVIKKL
jgi:hypothetical protein